MANKQITKQWHDATIQNNFVFGKTMETYPDLCRQLLELILNVKIKEIIYPERKKTIEARIDGKGIRLDVYVEEKNINCSFDVEIQISRTLRSRYFACSGRRHYENFSQHQRYCQRRFARH